MNLTDTQNSPPLDDAEILRQFRNPATREYAFRKFIEKYQRPLYYQIRRMVNDHDTASDVLQNVFLKVWNHLHNFREEARLSTWLYRIAANETLAFLEKEKKHRHNPIDDEENNIINTLKADPWFNGNELMAKLQAAISQLPEKQRLVFILRYFEEMKYEEMSEILNTSKGALKASFHHALKKIQHLLAEN